MSPTYKLYVELRQIQRELAHLEQCVTIMGEIQKKADVIKQALKALDDDRKKEM